MCNTQLESNKNRIDIEKIKSDYEYQINIMTGRIKQLQDEISVKKIKTM